jgi:hypothetical protein
MNCCREAAYLNPTLQRTRRKRRPLSLGVEAVEKGLEREFCTALSNCDLIERSRIKKGKKGSTLYLIYRP